MKDCSKCGGNGPFPSEGNICKACDAKRKADWYQSRKARGLLPSKKQTGTRTRTLYGICSVCGGNGPFPPTGQRCIACVRKANRSTQSTWRKNNPAQALKHVKDWQSRHPEQHLQWKRESMRRTRAGRKGMELNQELVQAIQSEVVQARSEGVGASDIKWMAVGAGIAYGRSTGIIGEEVSPEMNAAIIAMVEQELKKK